MVATLIDMLLVPALTVLLIITDVMEHAEDFRNWMWMLNLFLLAVMSYLILNGYWLFTRGQTFGKRVMGLRLFQHRRGNGRRSGS